MNDRLRLVSALLLVTAGLICIVFAVAQWPRVDPSVTPVQNHSAIREDNPDEDSLRDPPVDEIPGTTVPADAVPVPPGSDALPPAEEAPADEPPADDRDGAVAVPLSSDAVPPAAASARSAKMPQAHKDALMLWVLAGLPLVFVVLIVIVLVLRWLRPGPMARTGPSDTTDLWQEAGKRFRLQ